MEVRGPLRTHTLQWHKAGTDPGYHTFTGCPPSQTVSRIQAIVKLQLSWNIRHCSVDKYESTLFLKL